MKLIEQCTPAAEFYCNWFRGFRSVATGKLNNAKEHYKNAFAARRFAGCQFERFIKQAFALSCYADFNADKVRDSAEKDKKSRSPLSTDAKKYWNYGYAVGVFDRKAEGTHQILFHRVENILTYFGTSLFPENSEFYRDLKQQINGFKEEPKKEEEVKGVLDQPRELKDIDKYTSFKNGAFIYDLGKYQGSLLVNEIERLQNLIDKTTNYYLKTLAKNGSMPDEAVEMFNLLEGNK